MQINEINHPVVALCSFMEIKESALALLQFVHLELFQVRMFLSLSPLVSLYIYNATSTFIINTLWKL